MRAPARGLVDGKLLPMCEVKPHGKVYRQMDDELLSVFEADCATGVPVLATMMGMMMARIREAEKDRDYLLGALVLLLPMARCWADGGHTGDADDKAVSAAQLLVDELAPESIDPSPEMRRAMLVKSVARNIDMPTCGDECAHPSGESYVCISSDYTNSERPVLTFTKVRR